MVNPDFDPTDEEEDVIDVLRAEKRANPLLIREQTELGKGDINTALTRLTSAGWVRKVTRGLYEFVDDPRDVDESGDTAAAVGEARGAPPGGPDDLQPGEEPPETLLSDEDTAMLRERLAGSGAKLDGRVDAIRAMYARLRALGEAEKEQLLEPVDVEATGYKNGESVWGNVAKGHLSKLPGVSADQTGTWRYTGER